MLLQEKEKRTKDEESHPVEDIQTKSDELFEIDDQSNEDDDQTNDDRTNDDHVNENDDHPKENDEVSDDNNGQVKIEALFETIAITLIFLRIKQFPIDQSLVVQKCLIQSWRCCRLGRESNRGRYHGCNRTCQPRRRLSHTFIIFRV